MQPGQFITYVDKPYNGIVEKSHLRYIKIELININGETPSTKLYGIYRSDNFIEKKIYEKYLPGDTVTGKILGFDEHTKYLQLSIN